MLKCSEAEEWPLKTETRLRFLFLGELNTDTEDMICPECSLVCRMHCLMCIKLWVHASALHKPDVVEHVIQASIAMTWLLAKEIVSMVGSFGKDSVD